MFCPRKCVKCPTGKVMPYKECFLLGDETKGVLIATFKVRGVVLERMGSVLL